MIDIDIDVKRLFDYFSEAKRDLFIVGESARDLLLGYEVKVLNFTTDANSKEIELILNKHKSEFKYLKVYRYGTQIQMENDKIIHITAFNSSRHPFISDNSPYIESQLQRELIYEVFPINALAIDKNGRVIDYFGGQNEIKEKKISTIGEPAILFESNPIFLLKIAQLISELGFLPVSSLKESIKEHSSLILKIPQTEWLSAMDNILQGDFVKDALQFMADTALIEKMLPEVYNTIGFEQNCEYHHKDLWEHTKRAVESAQKEIDIRWTLLLHDIGKVYTRTIQNGEVHFWGHEIVSRKLFRRIARRFLFPKDRERKIAYLIGNHMRPSLYSSEWTDSAVRRLIKKTGEHLPDLLKVASADITSKRPEKIILTKERLNELTLRIDYIIKEDSKKNPLPKKIGEKIMERFNIPEGPEVGRRKKILEEAIQKGIIEGDKDLEYYLKYLEKLLVVS